VGDFAVLLKRRARLKTRATGLFPYCHCCREVDPFISSFRSQGSNVCGSERGRGTASLPLTMCRALVYTSGDQIFERVWISR
jgi:hypothetical protein